MKGLILLAVIQAAFGAAIVDKKAAHQCPMFCMALYAPVCGSDGKTYSNKCFLGIANCHDPSIRMASDGACAVKKRANVACPDVLCITLFDPVCGSDGKTYSNECFFNSATCGTAVTLAHKGRC